MPRVPTLDSPQVRDAGVAPAFVDAPNTGRQAQQAGAALERAGQVVDQLIQRQDQDVAWRTQAAINDAWVKFDADSRQNSQGQSAAGYATKVQDWWKEAAATYGKDLNPSARALISKNLAIAQTQAYGNALQFENRELERSRDEALDGVLSAEVSRGSAGGASAAAASAAIIDKTLTKYAADTGKPAEWLAQQKLQRTTALHANVISQLMQSDPAAAKTYFESNKGQIDGARYDEIGSRINQVSAATEGDAAAAKVWNELGPKTDLSPVELDKMEQAAREAFPNDPTRRDAALSGIRARAQAFEHSERQRAAGNTNSVFGMLDQGVPLSRVIATPQWNALPERDQRQIRLSIESEQATRASRAASESQRALAEAQRQERSLMLKNGDAYLRASDPAFLVTQTREAVAASRQYFGMEGAEHLLAKWDALQKPGAVAEAKLDTQQFNAYAQQMGLHPNETGKTEKEKDLLIQVQNRIETLIAQEQKARGKALTREEKDKLIQTEMAKQVMVDGGWFGSNKSVPVLQLTGDQVKKVIIPPADRKALAEKLQKRYQATQDPAYAPTEENLRAWYLAATGGRTAALVPPAK